MNTVYDVLIIGGGPAGLSTAYLCHKHGLSYLVLESGKAIFQGIANTYPEGKLVYASKPKDAPEPFMVDELRPPDKPVTVESYLQYVQHFVQHENLNVQTDVAFEDIRDDRDGLTVITDQEKVSFLRPMPLRTLYGVGKVTEQTLNKVGIATIGDLQEYPGDLRALVGSFGPKLKQFAFGDDGRPLEIGDEIKSISGEETFLKDTDDRKILRVCLKEQASDISARLKHKRLGAHTVQVKVRYTDFTTLTRQISVEEPLTEANDIYRLGCFLLGREKLVSRPLRLLGLGVKRGELNLGDERIGEGAAAAWGLASLLRPSPP